MAWLFGRDNAPSLKVGKTQKKLLRKGQRRSVKWLWTGGLSVLALVLVLIQMGSSPRMPKVGDHWHATYEVIICGERKPNLPSSPGNIHTHGDGVIHIHPAGPEEAGSNANLGRFFANSAITFTESTIHYPGGPAYRDGDPCPDGKKGQLRLIVNGKANAAMERYVPQDGDRIRVEFGPE